jgi:hypothetical protein
MKMNKYTYNGKEHSISELSKISGHSRTVIYNRLKRGWTVSDSVEKAAVVPKKYKYEGKDYTLKELAAISEINKCALYQRIKTGKKVEDAINTKGKIYKNKKYTYRGKTLSLSEWATYIGVTRQVVYGRIKMGWPIGRIIRTPVASEKIYIYYGKEYTARQLSNLSGNSKSLIINRIENLNWSVEKAVTTPVMARKKRHN